MRDDRPAVPSFAGRVFSSTLSFVTRPSGRPGGHLSVANDLSSFGLAGCCLVSFHINVVIRLRGTHKNE